MTPEVVELAVMLHANPGMWAENPEARTMFVVDVERELLTMRRHHRSILLLRACGLEWKQVAARLGISRAGVYVYRKSIKGVGFSRKLQDN